MAAEIKQTALYQDANLQGYWRFEDNYTDESGNGYTLTPSGSPTFVTDLFGKGVDLEAGSSQYAAISLASAPNLNTTGDFTWTCLFTPESIGAAQALMGNVNSSVDQGIRLGVTAAGKLDLRSFKSGDDQSVTHTTTLVAGTRYRLTAKRVASGNAITLYVGTTKVTGTFSRDVVSSSGDFAIGRLGNFSGEYADGIEDDAAVFDRALSDAEIENLDSGTPTTTSTSSSTSTTTTSTSTTTTSTSTSTTTTSTSTTTTSTSTTTSSSTSTSTTITTTSTTITTTSTTTTSTSTSTTTTSTSTTTSSSSSTSTTTTWQYSFEVEGEEDNLELSFEVERKVRQV